MIAILALMGGMLATSGCRSTGPSVLCVLPPPAPYAKPAGPPPAKTARPRKVALTTHHRHRMTPKPAPAPAAPPTGEEIDRHIASLVSIHDCTGARIYAGLVGSDALAAHIFEGCIAPPAASPAALPATPPAPPGPSLPPAPRLTPEALKSGQPIAPQGPGSVP